MEFKRKLLKNFLFDVQFIQRGIVCIKSSTFLGMVGLDLE